MQTIFVGGASGVGASCLAIELADQWFVVDAGVRVDRKTDPLPDLALLEGKDVRAIFVTHAHADHIGALPLLHQAFPTTPIYTSRGTALLMEVMLADALKIMTKRAVEEMELPLYPETLVAGMLTQVRPLPVGEPFTVPALPGVTVHASRAGHIAGAVSLGFVASEGSLVVSGDISSTPQRTVLGAVPPPVNAPDLLVLESTYGARLHPNRQGEEQRLAQAVADGLARGGHTLIPCFGLGRGQELLLLLQAAQEQGQIPDFPIYVDGLVRRVCSTYLLLPEALTPRLQRQIRKGFLPFSGRNVTFVRDERDRERILAGSPACILSSSGMLTGGPSVWYAARLASDANASILITGYQDEESPGRKLLDLAERKSSTLDIGGKQVQVNCQVAKYSLSAHADGGELAAYAAALKPRCVALVHGAEDARMALRTLLTETEVLLPSNGMTLEPQSHSSRGRSAGRRAAVEASISLPKLPTAIGEGVRFDYSHVEELWQAVTQVPSMRIVTARELAIIWYGEATEQTTQDILDTFAQDYEQRYFVQQHALEEAYRVRGQQEEAPGDFLSDLVGSVLLLQVAPESAKPVLCRSIEPGATVRVFFPKGISYERTRFPFSAIFEVLGLAPPEVQASHTEAALYLAELVRTRRRVGRQLLHLSAHDLAHLCQEEASYTLGELCTLADLSPNSLEERLTIAKLIYQHPHLFVQRRTVLEGEGLTLYGLAPEWREGLQVPEKQERPDQNWILGVIEKHIGSPPDLYRRSVDPDTGDVTLAFHFPAVAQESYEEEIAAAAEEAGISISIAPQAHQGALAKAARAHVPEGLSVLGSPSLYLEVALICLNCAGEADHEQITEAEESFYEETGWHLQLEGVIIRPSTQSQKQQQGESELPASTPAASAVTLPPVHIFPDVPDTPMQKLASGTMRAKKMSQHDAVQFAQQMLGKLNLPGYYKVGAEVPISTLVLRFHFPKAAQQRYQDVFAQLEAQTGWTVRLHPTVHQQALDEMARRVVPEGLTCIATPSIHHAEETVRVQCGGTATAEVVQQAQQRFLDETGWRLELLLPAGSGDAPQRMAQGVAIAQVSEAFSAVPDLYRIGVDTMRGALWLHFHFPDVARQRYAEQLATLTEQTSWRMELHPNAHQKALVEAACRALPEGLTMSGKSVVQERRLLALTCIGSANTEAMEEAARRFAEETGWELKIIPLG